MTDDFYRRAEVVRVLDGDSYELRVDLGYRVYGRFIVRLRGIDCAELPTAEGKRAKVAAERLFSSAKEITVKSYKDQQSFARWLVDMWLDGVPMTDLLHQVIG